MKIEQVLPISSFMDDTLDRESIQSEQGVVRKRINMRPDNIGDVMANVPIPGTVMVSMDLPAGENKTVGWCNDNESEGIIWFVYNSLGNHSILRYNGTVQKIFYGEFSLNLTDNLVNAEVVQGRLYWNDNTDHPKSFNIQKAIDYTAGLTTGYTEEDKPFEDNVFPYIKRPPRFKPEVTYEDRTKFDGVEIDFNNLRKKLWQAKYNYVYEDNQESVYSPISKVPLPEAEVSTNGIWVDEITRNNTLKITVNTGGHLVKKINVAVRDASNLNSGPFYRFKIIEKYDHLGVQVIEDNLTYDVYFLNNTYLESIDNEYGTAYFHDVPLRAKDLLLLDGKNISMSMPTSGYDIKEESVDYSLSYVEEDADFSSAYIEMEVYNFEGSGTFKKDKFTKITIPAFRQNSTYMISIACPDGAITGTYNTGAAAPANYPASVRDNLVSQMFEAFYDCYSNVSMSALDDNVISLQKKDSSTYFDVIAKVTIGGLSASFKGLKRGQYHQFVIVYNDAFGRYNVAFGDEKIYSPLFPADSLFRKVVKPKVTINSLPPLEAVTYRIAYIPYNSYTYSLVVPVVEQVTSSGTNGIPTGKYFLKINQSILNVIEKFPNSQIEAYVWQNGDRVRRYGDQKSYEILKEYTRVYTSGVESITETGYLIDVELTKVAGTDKIDALEIYRPNRTPQDKVMYEIGEEFEILNPGTASRVHAGRDQDQTAALPAVSTLDFGDVYLRERFTGDVDVSVIYAEDNHFSDYYISSAISIGRGAVRIESKQTTLKRAILSENYIQDSKLNRLNIFLPLGQVYEVSEIYGDIQRMIERGDTLKIIQDHKETSVYIGKNYAKDADGNDIVLISDKTFGSDNVYESYLGSTYPRAVAANEKTFYFFDLFTGDFCRSATNGTISLSKQYRMQKELDLKARSFRAFAGKKDIIVSVSPNDTTIYLTFITDKIETIAFSDNEGNKGFMFWVEFSNGDLKPENFAWYGDDMYSFVNGKLHIHGQGAVNSFYGSARKSAKIEMVTNQKIQKKYEAVSLDTNGDWTATMEIEKDNNYPYGQKTRILKFRNQGGRLYSAVPRNIITRSGSEDLQKLYSGNEMLGNAMKITAESVNFDKLRELKIISTTT